MNLENLIQFTQQSNGHAKKDKLLKEKQNERKL